MMNFHGVKIALIVDGKLLMHLRDNRPGLFNANMWNFPGGGREREETPEECIIRELEEELGIKISRDDIIWKKYFPAQKDASQQAGFMVANLDQNVLSEIKLTEGQKWTTFTQEEFFEREDVIEPLKVRFKDYLDSK